jgi:spermidine/putrescine transport system permease protein
VTTTLDAPAADAPAPPPPVAPEEGRRGGVIPYLLCVPGLVWLAIFFVIPMVTLFKTSLSVNAGSVYLPELDLTWEFSNYTDAFNRYGTEFWRSFRFAAAATILALVLAYPLAYVIAFKSGRFKNLLLGLVILPFFVTFLLRTLAWKTIVADGGTIVGILETLGMLPSEDRLLNTSWSVIGGLTYNFLPFMILPIYVSLEKIDPRLLEASRDLYASGLRTFRKVLLPLSLPGIFAGSLLTFIPAAGDFINAEYLGGPSQTMVGNVIQTQFIDVKDYPLAAALSFVLMAIILLGVLLYAKVLGTEDIA